MNSAQVALKVGHQVAGGALRSRRGARVAIVRTLELLHQAGEVAVEDYFEIVGEAHDGYSDRTDRTLMLPRVL